MWLKWNVLLQSWWWRRIFVLLQKSYNAKYAYLIQDQRHWGHFIFNSCSLLSHLGNIWLWIAMNLPIFFPSLWVADSLVEQCRRLIKSQSWCWPLVEVKGYGWRAPDRANRLAEWCQFWRRQRSWVVEASVMDRQGNASLLCYLFTFMSSI